MRLNYIYNERTGTLHIKGFCPHGKAYESYYKVFETEQDAHTYAGRSIKPCKICENKKEKMLKEEVK